MKKLKSTRMYAALEARIKLQEERIHYIAVEAFISLKRPKEYDTGSFYSDRFIPKNEVL